MNRLLILTSLILLALPKVSFGQDVANNNLIDQALLLEDYDFLLKTLEETHPNLYAYIPKEEFIEKTNEFRASINKPLSKPDFKVEPTYNDYINNFDRVMNYTYWLIDEGITK